MKSKRGMPHTAGFAVAHGAMATFLRDPSAPYMACINEDVAAQAEKVFEVIPKGTKLELLKVIAYLLVMAGVDADTGIDEQVNVVAEGFSKGLMASARMAEIGTANELYFYLAGQCGAVVAAVEQAMERTGLTYEHVNTDEFQQELKRDAASKRAQVQRAENAILN